MGGHIRPPPPSKVRVINWAIDVDRESERCRDRERDKVRERDRESDRGRDRER